MTTETQNLSLQQKEIVAVGASIGAGCHPCVAHHLKAGATAGLEGEQLLAAATSAERITAEAAVLMADHVRAKIGATVTTPAMLTPLEETLAALGAALGANDAAAIDLQMRAAADQGASRSLLRQVIETAKTVQENAGRIHVREAERVLDSIETLSSATENDANPDTGCGCDAAQTEEAPAATASMGCSSEKES
jgi:AhpD family alkylhydroperoxidase